MRSLAILLLSAAGLLAQPPGPFRPGGNVPAGLPPTVPSKGPAWVYPAVAFIDSAGYIDGLVGINGTDCIHIDGTSGPCAGASSVPVFSWAEVPSGTLNGVNTVFTLLSIPNPAASLELFRNGILQKASGVDYTLSGLTVTFVAGAIPQAGDLLLATYQSGYAGGTPATCAANTVVAGPTSGAPALPTCRALVAGDIPGGGGGGVWGSITGTLSSQTDLNTALNAKEATANKDAASGYAGLTAGGLLKTAEAPIWNQNTTGNAATATALAATPTLCGAGNAPTGVLANGNATGCAPLSGGGTAAQYTSVTFSATPTFTASSNTVNSFAIVLTGNVTSSTLASSVAGQIYNFKVCQDATGGRTFVWPTGFALATTPSTVALNCTRQSFFWDGAAANPLGPAAVDSGPGVPTYCPDTSGAANTITCASNGNFVSYVTGDAVIVKVANSVTGATTINVSGLGAKNVTKNGTTALASGDLVAGGIYLMTYDGAEFVVYVGGSGNAITALTGDVSATGPGSAAAVVAKVNGISISAAEATASKTRTCTVIIGDPGAASTALADDNDSPVACSNDWATDWTITAVACWANAGSPTVTPILTGGTGTSVLTGALTCGTAAWAAGTVNGSPVVHAFSANGATCSSTPCTIDDNITTAGGTAKYLIIKVIGTI